MTEAKREAVAPTYAHYLERRMVENEGWIEQMTEQLAECRARQRYLIEKIEFYKQQNREMEYYIQKARKGREDDL